MITDSISTGLRIISTGIAVAMKVEGTGTIGQILKAASGIGNDFNVFTELRAISGFEVGVGRAAARAVTDIVGAAEVRLTPRLRCIQEATNSQLDRSVDVQ